MPIDRTPNEMTDEELEALPTLLDLQRVAGGPIRIVARSHKRGDIAMWFDAKGRGWMFGETEPGVWYKK